MAGEVGAHQEVLGAPGQPEAAGCALVADGVTALVSAAADALAVAMAEAAPLALLPVGTAAAAAAEPCMWGGHIGDFVCLFLVGGVLGHAIRRYRYITCAGFDYRRGRHKKKKKRYRSLPLLSTFISPC